ncbi:hypothetical protein HHI36_005512, partial [Cryptolaemus montrouzieri]
MTDNMLSHICEYTNRWGNAYTDIKNETYPNPSQWINITVDELQAFIGVLIASGRNRGRNYTLQKCGLNSILRPKARKSNFLARV